MSIREKLINLANSTVTMLLLGLFFMVGIVSPSSAKTKHKKKSAAVEYKMTVARIVPASPADSFIEITFSESQRFYRLPVKAKPAMLNMLKESEAKNSPVLVKRASERSDVIIDVKRAKR